jgi:1,4-dihydroxy-2-naphthoyl-CoA hydrolase
MPEDGRFVETGAVKLADTDAAGLLFFANSFKLAHNVYESFLGSIGFSLRHVIESTDYLLPIVHAEADFRSPLKLGDRFSISLKSKVQTHSFVLTAYFTGPDNVVAGEVRTVHVSVSKATGKKVPLAKDLKDGLVQIS